MKQETKKPLYKVLDEQRTKGVWNKQGPIIADVISGQTCYTIYVPGTFDVVGVLYPHSNKDGNMNLVNVEYINLAVNNLSDLAEAMEGLINNPMPSAKAQGYERRMDNYFKAVERAKEVLAHIS